MELRWISENPVMRATSRSSSTTTGSAINAWQSGICEAMLWANSPPRLEACSPPYPSDRCLIMRSLTVYVPDGMGLTRPPRPMTAAKFCRWNLFAVSSLKMVSLRNSYC